MNRTDRLLAIVLELQAKGTQRAQDLAATFETSTRTIYRDVQALCEAGVPVVAVTGQGYSLMEGYFLPPLRFTTDEATMLLLGSDYVAQNFDAEYRAAALSATRKIEAVLPNPLRGEVQDLQSEFRFVTSDPLARLKEPNLLPRLRRAIVSRRRVRFRYHARFGQERDRSRMREADPYGLAHVSDVWYLVAFDHLRHDLRHFRLERMEQLTVLAQTFERPADFTMLQNAGDQSRFLIIRARFDPAVTRWVRESRFFFMTDEQETGQGLLVTLRVREESEALPWLLSWGAHVHVLQPDSIRRRLAEEAEGILKNHR